MAQSFAWRCCSCDRYARGPGRLDWASQPDPFRRYEGAPLLHLPRHSFEPDGSAPEPQHHTLSHTPHTHTSSFPSWDEISLGITPQLSQPQLPSQPTQLSSQQASQPTHGPQPISLAAVSQLLYYSLALSGWKAAGGEAWSLRVDPSSGNLHPTEAHLILPPMGSHVAGGGPFVAHYAPRWVVAHAILRLRLFPCVLGLQSTEMDCGRCLEQS